MRDRVGEVLAQRAAMGGGATPAIAFSVLLHGGATAIAIYIALHQPPPQTANIVNIHFAPMPAASHATTATHASAKAQPVKPVEKPKAIPPLTPAVTAPAAKPVPLHNTAPPSPFGRSTKKPGDVPPPPAAAPAAATVPGVTSGIEVPIGGSGVTGLEGGDFPYTIYIENMKRLIGTHWFRPQVTPGTTSTVTFTIVRDGSIRDARVETASNNGTFDRAALRAILESSPLPPLPFAYNGSYLGVHLTFK